ncbi:FAD-dependent oxidoreductase [Pararhodobacter sp.]|uniref:NAD(P)/FAD-dependent oxidoreductase n=1 Tax=Pararhodobacter sp. TaxID=2127056 RepID=UPI002AFE4B3F|nr:FAD-dependent oxidoreductase [Pararhodobacter sp.]
MLDFLIIGGGIAGLSAGARVSALGRVLVVESEASLGYHTSGRSAALYEADYGAPATVAVARASGADLEALGVMSPRGFMVVGRAQDRVAFDADVQALRLAVIPKAEALDRFPILDPEAVALAAYTDSAKNIDTDLLMQTYARMIRANGGEIRTKAPVQAMERVAGGWRATLKGETLTARRVINAAGAWADGVARMAGIAPIGITPYRRSIAQIPPPGGRDVSGWPMVIGAGETWYAKPEAGKLLISPAEEDPMEPHDAYSDDMVLAEGLARYEEMMIEPVIRVETSWAGLRSFAPDRTLVLGPDPRDPGFVWCAGQGGQGFLSAPGAARVLAETLGGPASGLSAAVVQALSPARFR